VATDVVFGFSGRPYDAATGLYDNRARWYDPAVGRFVSEDPLGFAAGDVNVYRYVGNCPTVATGSDSVSSASSYNYATMLGTSLSDATVASAAMNWSTSGVGSSDSDLYGDYFSAYRKYLADTDLRVPFCWAHLIRDIAFLTTRSDRATKRWGDKLLREAKRLPFSLTSHTTLRPHCSRRLRERLRIVSQTRPPAGFVSQS
jgi:RHS repeat-associated protein